MSGPPTGLSTTRPVPIDLSLTDALALIGEVATRHRVGPETLALSRCHGRVLSQSVEMPGARQSPTMAMAMATARTAGRRCVAGIC